MPFPHHPPTSGSNENMRGVLSVWCTLHSYATFWVTAAGNLAAAVVLDDDGTLTTGVLRLVVENRWKKKKDTATVRSFVHCWFVG